MTDFDLKDSDLYHDYCDRPQAWRFEHVTAPRQSWMDAGKKRTRAPEQGVIHRTYKPIRSTNYKSIWLQNNSWGYNFLHRNTRHQKWGFESDHAAAMAHDALVIEQGIERELLLPDAEEQTA